MESEPAIDLVSKRPRNSVATTIGERLSEEIVIALVGPVGSGVSTAAGYLRDILSQDFGYEVCPTIIPSEIIRAEAPRIGMTNLPTAPLDEYITQMQTAGNLLRDRFGGNYLAEKAVERIYKYRREKGGLGEQGQLIPGRRAYIIDSLKNLEELALLRQIYRDTLCVFGIFAPDALRALRLKNNNVPDSSLKNIMDRDKGEVATFGQKTRKVFVQADFFVCNDRKRDELRTKLYRYLSIIFNIGVHTPKRAESAMYEAYSAASKSACMSRQVGAAIVSKGGELISVGWNDVPRFGGGLYCEDDQFIIDNGIVDKDHRCFKWGGNICHNETRRTGILEKLARNIFDSGMIKKESSYADVRALFDGTEIDSLIEFSRSIHAEMEAILSVAREGRHSLVGATLYTNTYPCHNCARHIVASGITHVIYIEPYDKSLAIALHNDAITEDTDDKTRVIFRQYDGVAPVSYLRLFRPTESRKKDGRLVRRHEKTAVPIFQIPLDSPVDYEAQVIAELSEKEQSGLQLP